MGRTRTQAATENQHNKMQNYCKTIGALAAVSALVAGNVKAEIEYELHTGYSSEYLYRGVNLGDNLIEAGADVKGKAYGLDLSAGAWYGSVNTKQVLDQNLGFGSAITLTELDLYAGASKDFGPVTGSVGYIHRNYDLSPLVRSVNTGEVSFGLSRDFGIFDASLTYFWGVEGIKIQGTSLGSPTEGYTELALHRGFAISPCLNLNVSTNVGYLVEDDTFTAWTTKVALDWGFAEHAKLSPFIAASLALSEARDTLLWNSTNNQLVGGCMLSVNF